MELSETRMPQVSISLFRYQSPYSGCRNEANSHSIQRVKLLVSVGSSQALKFFQPPPKKKKIKIHIQHRIYQNLLIGSHTTFPNPNNVSIHCIFCVWVCLDYKSGAPTCYPIWLAFSLIKAFVGPQTGCITRSAPLSPVFMATWH